MYAVGESNGKLHIDLSPEIGSKVFIGLGIRYASEPATSAALVGIRPPGFLHNWISYRRLPALSRSYMEINYALKRIKRNPSVQDTPTERAIALIQAIPTAAIPANHLLAEYQTSTYSPRQADEEVAHKAAMEVRNLSWLARLGRLLERYQEPDRNR